MKVHVLTHQSKSTLSIYKSDFFFYLFIDKNGNINMVIVFIVENNICAIQDVTERKKKRSKNPVAIIMPCS